MVALQRSAAVVLASSGLTGTALWIGPVLVAIGLISGGLGRRDGLRAGVAAAVAPAGAAVIAPQDVAAWITTFRHHPCPLLVRRTFFAILARAVPADEARRRGWAAVAVETPG